MSASYSWRPVITQPEDGLSYSTVAMLADLRHMTPHDMNDESLTRSDLPVLAAIRAATSSAEVTEDVTALIAAIEQHGEVEIVVSY